MRRLQTLVVLGALVATIAGCDLVAASGIDQARSQAGAPAVARSATLATSAKAHAQANCDAHTATASSDPIPGEGHATDINMTGPYGTDHTGPFLFQQLRLDR